MNQTNITWETPQRFWDNLNEEFNFTLDVCALQETAKCKKYFTPEMDGLSQDWSGEIFWMNPPYGRGQNVYEWVKKAYFSCINNTTVGVCLLPGSIDTKWFHEFCMNAAEIRIVADRLWFSNNGGKPARSNHSSIIVIFKQHHWVWPRVSSISNHKPLF